MLPPSESQTGSTEQLYLYAKGLIPAEDGKFEIGHVQALLLLSLFNLGYNRQQAAWMLVGQAARIAIQLGLNRCSPTLMQPLKPVITSREIRVFLGCFALDTIIAARLGRCAHLGVEYIDSIGGAIEENGLEEWDPWIDCLGKRKQEAPVSLGPPLIFSTFNRFVGVLRTLNEISREGGKDSRQAQRCGELINRLHMSNNRPDEAPQLSLASVPDSTMLPHHFNFHLIYLTTMATLRIRQHRAGNLVDGEQSPMQALSILLQQILDMVGRYLDVFGPFISPPTFEYYPAIVFESGHVIDECNSLAPVPTLHTGWKLTVLGHVKELCRVWPVFAALQATLEREYIMDASIAAVCQSRDIAFSQDPLTVEPQAAVKLLSEAANSEADQAADRRNALSLAEDIDQYGVTAHRTPNRLTSTPNLSQPQQLEDDLLKHPSLWQHNEKTSVDVLPQWNQPEQPVVNTRASPLPSLVQESDFSQSPFGIESTFRLDQDVLFNEFSTVDAMEW
jgi:hypothetical protein